MQLPIAKHVSRYMGAICFAAFAIVMFTLAYQAYQMRNESKAIYDSLISGNGIPAKAQKLTEGELKRIRTDYITECKYKRSMEWFQAVGDARLPRSITGAEIVSCIDEAFSLDGDPSFNTKFKDAVRFASLARREMYDVYYQTCRKNELPELACLEYADREMWKLLK